MAVELISNKKMNHTISHLPGVVAEVRKTADKVARLAKGNLREHFFQGESSIQVDKGPVDSYVHLVSDGAVPLEMGHRARDGSWVEGVHALSRAAMQARG